MITPQLPSASRRPAHPSHPYHVRVLSASPCNMLQRSRFFGCTLRHRKHPRVLFLLWASYVNYFQHYMTPIYHLSTDLAPPRSWFILIRSSKFPVFPALQICVKTAHTRARCAQDLAACLLHSNSDSDSNSKSFKFDGFFVTLKINSWRRDLFSTIPVTPPGLPPFRGDLHASIDLIPFLPEGSWPISQ